MRVLKIGAKGADIAALQKALTAAGFSTVADGDFGPATEVQVKAFQESKELVVDGIAGAKTWEALGMSAPKYIMGVDVSHYEAGFDFVKGVKDGVVFMMTKASEGTGLDNTCGTLCLKAKQAGIKYKGIYHFFHSHIRVSDQIFAYFKQYNSLNLEMSAILDLEETSVNGKSVAEVKDAALDWLQKAELKTRSGKVPIIYIDMNMLNILKLNEDPRFNKYPRWVARYSSNEPTVSWTFWQFTDKGEQGADTDWFHGTEEDLKKFLGVV